MREESRTAEDVLVHFGVKGMKWGVRKREGGSSSPSTSNSTGGSGSGGGSSTPNSSGFNKKKAALILGGAIGVAAIAAGSVYAAKHMDSPISLVGVAKDASGSKKGKAYVDAMLQEPASIVHAARGRDKGWTFPERGGLDDPVHEFDRSGVTDLEVNTFKRYGERSEKVAANFADPEGRIERAGRPINHFVMLPEEMAKSITRYEDIVPLVWPILKDKYDILYGEDEDKYARRAAQ